MCYLLQGYPLQHTSFMITFGDDQQPIGPQRKICKIYRHLLFAFCISRPMEKIVWNCSKWVQEDLCPSNPDLASTLGTTYLDFDIFHVVDLFGFQISECPGFQTGPGPCLGRPGLELDGRSGEPTGKLSKMVPKSCMQIVSRKSFYAFPNIVFHSWLIQN